MDDAQFIHETILSISGKIERQSKRLISRDFEQLSMAEAKALLVLRDGEARNMTLIARMLGVALSTATTTIDRLARKKLVHRSVADEDRRKWLVRLTPKAVKMVGEMERHAIAGTVKFLECLSTDEVAFLKRILGKINDNLDEGA
jgi:DNA-binding MarR family transcriptional regulator